LERQEDLCKKVLCFYAHRAAALGYQFSMIGAGATSLGKKICLAARQFNIDTVVMGKQGLGHIKSGLGSTASYVVENLDGTVMIVKAPIDNVISDQERLTASIHSEKMIDIAYVVDKRLGKEPKIMYDGPSFVEFYLKDIDSVLQELKQEREELKELLEGVKAEQQETKDFPEVEGEVAKPEFDQIFEEKFKPAVHPKRESSKRKWNNKKSKSESKDRPSNNANTKELKTSATLETQPVSEKNKGFSEYGLGNLSKPDHQQQTNETDLKEHSSDLAKMGKPQDKDIETAVV